MKRFLLDPSTAAGDRYSPVVVTPTTIARRASSARVLRAARDLSRRLATDSYTRYVGDFYEKGLNAAGDDWAFMDIVSLLYAIGEMGRPENYLEIGVRRGRSACALAVASPDTDIFAFDIWQRGYAQSENPGPDLVREELARFGHRGRVAFHDGDSHETVPQFFREHPDLTFDVITVDGDHSVDGARDDLKNVAPRLRVGGVLVFDDTANPYCPGLDRVWNDLLATDRGLRGFSYNELGTGVSFALRMHPPRAHTTLGRILRLAGR